MAADEARAAGEEHFHRRKTTLCPVVEGEQQPDPGLERAGGDLPPEPPGVAVPWRDVLAWIAAFFVVLWAAVLVPGIVSGLRERAGVGVEEGGDFAMPAMPDDPPLSAEVVELVRRGRELESSAQLVLARAHYHKAVKLEPRCFSCRLRLRVVERLIREECVEALNAGARYLEEGRFEEAAGQYQKVLGLVPHQKANFHILAKQGLAEARKGAEASGHPLP
jgi:tetratricopeptide (TPR) repeat protein